MTDGGRSDLSTIFSLSLSLCPSHLFLRVFPARARLLPHRRRRRSIQTRTAVCRSTLSEHVSATRQICTTQWTSAYFVTRQRVASTLLYCEGKDTVARNARPITAFQTAFRNTDDIQQRERKIPDKQSNKRSNQRLNRVYLKVYTKRNGMVY